MRGLASFSKQARSSRETHTQWEETKGAMASMPLGDGVRGRGKGREGREKEREGKGEEKGERMGVTIDDTKTRPLSQVPFPG